MYLNVIRPSGVSEHHPLPVLLWIYGGGYVQGGAPDLRYNLSFIVQRSVEIDQPVIGVSINYRLSAWGWLNSDEVKASGQTNLGLRDQRLALHWVHENIAAFSGDPKKVTIWGQSAGAESVGLHLIAYDGRDDDIFHGAIMESGTPINSGPQTTSLQSKYDQLTQAVGCGDTTDSLDCLRSVPYETLNAAINTTALSSIWHPYIDGDIFARHASQQVAESNFVKVPIILGTNTDEGTSFAPQLVNTTEQAFQRILSSAPGMTEDFANKVFEAYPLVSPDNELPNLDQSFVPPAYPWGTQWRRVATYYGDKMFIANRRKSCETWAAHGLSAYCFRFNAIPAWSTPLQGATHFVEVAFAMLDLDGVGYPPVRVPPFEGLGEEYKDLARLMSSDWIAFANHGDPNKWMGRKEAAATLGEPVPNWPKYSVPSKTGHTHCIGRPSRNFLYEANVTSSVEPDTWRKQGIELLISGNLEVYDR